MQRSLEELRREIDRVNLELLKLLNERTNLVKEISDLKDQTGTDYFDPVREAEMLESILRRNRGLSPMNCLKKSLPRFSLPPSSTWGLRRRKNC